jgi:transcriptional regulator with XRE-family HTH domain
MTDDTIAARLRRTRLSAGLSQHELSRLAGLGPSQVRMIEIGARRAPSGLTLAALARVLGVRLDWLVEGTGAEPAVSTVRARVRAARLARYAARLDS